MVNMQGNQHKSRDELKNITIIIREDTGSNQSLWSRLNEKT